MPAGLVITSLMSQSSWQFADIDGAVTAAPWRVTDSSSVIRRGADSWHAGVSGATQDEHTLVPPAAEYEAAQSRRRTAPAPSRPPADINDPSVTLGCMKGCVRVTA